MSKFIPKHAKQIIALTSYLIGFIAGIALTLTIAPAFADHHVMLLSQCLDVKDRRMRVVELHVVERKTGEVVKHWYGETFVGELDGWATERGIDTDTHDAPIIPVSRRGCKPKVES